MKFALLDVCTCLLPSLPVRGAWVEIEHLRSVCRQNLSLPVRGAWVEISAEEAVEAAVVGRSPCGERGLKLWRLCPCMHNPSVAPRAGSVG